MQFAVRLVCRENCLKTVTVFFQLQRFHHLYVTRLAQHSEHRIANHGALGSKPLRWTCSSSCTRCGSQSTVAAAEWCGVCAEMLWHRSVASRTAHRIWSRAISTSPIPPHEAVQGSEENYSAKYQLSASSLTWLYLPIRYTIFFASYIRCQVCISSHISPCVPEWPPLQK